VLSFFKKKRITMARYGEYGRYRSLIIWFLVRNSFIDIFTACLPIDATEFCRNFDSQFVHLG
jgi:hypothetical protein